MGSDSSPHVLFEGVVRASEELPPSSTIVVFATQQALSTIQKPASQHHAKIEFFSVPNAISMTDDPIRAAKIKDSSLVTGIRQLKKKQLDAFISAGNTGALLTSATLQLPRLPGIKRPALLVCLPTVTGSVAVLDVGGNVSCKAHQLVQFAHMGAAYQSCNEGIEKPTVGLLNIGVEPKKGTSVIRETYEMLTSDCGDHLQFLGNVEGREVFQGKTDVLVTDGFTGNVLLKTAEGVSSFIFDFVQDAISGAPSHAFEQVLSNLRRYFSYSEYPGAFVCGVEGVVMKCHGHSSSRAMQNGIKGAAHLVEKRVVAHLKERLQQCLIAK